MKQIDTENHNNRLVIAAMFGMVKYECMSPEEVYARISDIKSQIHFALVEAEGKAKEQRNEV